MNLKKIFGLAAVAGFLFVAAPSQQASAMSLASPAGAAAVQDDAAGVATQVQYRHGHRGWHGHRGGWHRPHFVRRHHGWHRPHHWHRRHWR